MVQEQNYWQVKKNKLVEKVFQHATELFDMGLSEQPILR